MPEVISIALDSWNINQVRALMTSMFHPFSYHWVCKKSKVDFEGFVVEVWERNILPRKSDIESNTDLHTASQHHNQL